MNKNLIYNNDILYNKINNSSNILIIDKNYENFFDENILIKKKIKVQNSSYSDFFEILEEKKFDFIIFYDLFSKSDKLIQKNLDKGHKLLKNRGHIILINNVITNYSQYTYHPLSYLQKYIFGKSVYLNNLEDTLKEFDFKIINLTRLYTINFITFPIEYFCIIISQLRN
jgi:hypothetical protein